MQPGLECWSVHNHCQGVNLSAQAEKSRWPAPADRHPVEQSYWKWTLWPNITLTIALVHRTFAPTGH